MRKLIAWDHRFVQSVPFESCCGVRYLTWRRYAINQVPSLQAMIVGRATVSNYGSESIWLVIELYEIDAWFHLRSYLRF